MADIDKLLRLPTVTEIVALKRSAIYQKVRDGEFPAPVRLGSGRSVAWRASQIKAWVDSRESARGG